MKHTRDNLSPAWHGALEPSFPSFSSVRNLQAGPSSRSTVGPRQDQAHNTLRQLQLVEVDEKSKCIQIPYTKKAKETKILVVHPVRVCINMCLVGGTILLQTFLSSVSSVTSCWKF